METIYTNCKVVLKNEVIDGSIVVEDGVIQEIFHSPSSLKASHDLEGDFLLPGLIEMHTDNLEKNIQPRPGVIWPSTMAATLAHDVQVVGAGITTVFDAVAVGGLRSSGLRTQILNDSINTITKGIELGLYKADHHIHLRCEIGSELMGEMLDAQANQSIVKLISIMDHTPGQRQWRDIEKWRLYHRDKKWTEKEVEQILADLVESQRLYAERHKQKVVQFAKEKQLPLASHDDTTENDVNEGVKNGVSISEFPTTLKAARHGRKNGLKAVMGAPNAIRGISHSGNVSATLLAEEGLLDGLSSDYVPTSLLHAAFHLSSTLGQPLSQTVSMVSANIAEMVGLHDRGEIAEGKLADLLRVKLVNGLPVIRQVWKRGAQVC